MSHRDPFHPKAGGVGRTIFEVGTRLSKMGLKVTIYSSEFEGGDRTQTVDSLTIYRLGSPLTSHLILPVFLLKYKPDIVINDLGHAVPWLSPILFNKKNIVFFHHLHRRSLRGQVNPVLALSVTLIEKCYFLFFKNQVFVTESKTAKSDLDGLNVEKRSLNLIPPGVDHLLFHPYPKTAYPSIVYFGGLRKYKRPEESVYILKSLLSQFPKLKLFVIGNGPELSKLKEISAQLGLTNSIFFTGRLSGTQLAKIVASCWLNLHTSITEGWGFSIMEAASAGTPTVAYNVPGVIDAIEQGVNGIKVTDCDRPAIVDAARVILENPELWWVSSVKSSEKYSWDKTAEYWDELIFRTASS